MSMDLRNKLIEYEIEYTFYCAEDKARSAAKQSPSRGTKEAKLARRLEDESGARQPGFEQDQAGRKQLDEASVEANDEPSTNAVADVTANLIIQHLLANNHLKTLRSNQSSQ